MSTTSSFRVIQVLIGVLLLGWSSVHAQGLDPFREAHQYRSAITGPLVRGATPASAGVEAFAKYDQADFQGARAEIEKVIDRMRDANEPVKQAAAMDFLGVINLRQGRLGEALDSHRQALRLAESLGPVALEARFNALNNLAIVHYFRADYQEAEKQLTQIIAEAGASPRTAARALNNRGLIHEALGDLDKARSDFDRAKSRAGMADKRLRSQILNNQARIYGREANVADAEPLLAEARKLAKEMGDTVLEANVLDSWGEILADNRKPAEALAKLDEARAEEAKSPAPLVALSVATTRGKALLGLGRHADALAELDRAVNEARRLRVPALERQALALRGDVRVALVGQAGDPKALDQAIEDYGAAIAIAQETRDKAPKEREKDFVTSVQSLYEAAIKARIRRGKAGDREEAMTLFGGLAAVALHGHLAAAIPALRDADAQRSLEGAKGILAKEAALADALKQVTAPGSGATRAFIDGVEEQLRQVRREVPVAVGELVQKHGPLYRAYVTISPLQFADIKNQLPPRHLLVGFLPTERDLYIFLASPESGVEFRQVAVTKKDLDDRIREYRQLTTKVGGVRSDWQIDSWADAKWEKLQKSTTWLYDRLLAPIRDQIARAEHVVLAPTGLLYYLPIHALGPYNAATGELRFLALDKPVSYLTDNALLKALDRQRRPRVTSILAFGNPSFQQPGLQPLKYAEQEVEALKALFGRGAVELAGAAATKPALLAALGTAATPATAIATRGPAFGFVHLATHGVTNTRDPLESWLALDGQNKLAAREVPALDLRGVNLVTLSACETALAGENPGSDLMSLAMLFGQAGAASVMVSLWSVDDLSTRDLMKAFYEKLLKGGVISKAQALREAQLALATTKESRHPFFWAAFIMIGDWR